MKILYISSTSAGMHSHGIYYDLFKELSDLGNDVTIAYAREAREKKKTEIYHQDGMTYLGIKSPNMTKNKNLIEKGYGVLTIDYYFLNAVKRHLSNEQYDVVMYSTPPITFTKTLNYFARKGSFLYLMLKDIFPQNCIDLELFTKKSLPYLYFRWKERALYRNADLIGVMSQANKDFLLDNNKELGLENKTYILPNAIKVQSTLKVKMGREKYGIAEDDLVLIYGGNLGIPQDVDYVIECIKALEEIQGVKFIICGKGSSSYKIEDTIKINDIQNTKYLGSLPTDEYNMVTQMSDVGLIFLDHRFTIPNYPQRVLSYLEACLPVLASTDMNTDVGTDAEANGYGFSLPSNNVGLWISKVEYFRDNPQIRKEMGLKGHQHLLKEFNVESVAQDVISTVSKHKK